MQGLISLCATARADSSFSMSKEPSTITMPTRTCFPSLGEDLSISKEFANALGRPADAGATVGKISIGAAMQPIEVQTLVNGETKSVVMPPLRAAARSRRAGTGFRARCNRWRSAGHGAIRK